MLFMVIVQQVGVYTPHHKPLRYPNFRIPTDTFDFANFSIGLPDA